MLLATPPDTQPSAEKRVADILALVRNTFAEKGFDGASMQDLARAAGMSVGNFYRYFPSKSAIVEQLIAHDLTEMQHDFMTVIGSGDPIESLRQTLRLRLKEHQDCNHGQLWAEINATALRKPEIGTACHHMEAAIQAYFAQVFAAATGLTIAEAEARFSAHAAFIVLLFKSVAMMPPQEDRARDDLNALVLRTINQTLDEVAGVRKSVKNA